MSTSGNSNASTASADSTRGFTSSARIQRGDLPNPALAVPTSGRSEDGGRASTSPGPSAPVGSSSQAVPSRRGGSPARGAGPGAAARATARRKEQRIERRRG
ncbi:MAG: hypothetical protein QM704_21290 [Anaeromyxobacteraceae bacterium]